MKKHSIYLLLLSAIFLFLSCEKDSNDPDEPIIPTFDNGIIISCEGAFGSGNATIHYLDPAESTIMADIYQSINQENVGDVLQSITFDDQYAYIVVNNSGQIILADRTTFQKEGTIEGLSAPTEIRLKNGKGYIGNLYNPFIKIADLDRSEVVDSLYAGVSSEKILIEGNTLFILSHSEYQGRVKDHIYTIDLTDGSLDSIQVSANPLEWSYNEQDDQLYLFCQGQFGEEPAAIFTINTATVQVEEKTEIPEAEGSFSQLAYDPAGQRVLISLDAGIYSYDLAGHNLDNEALISLDEVQFLYALAVDPQSGDIYLGDALDFNQRGDIYIYDQNGDAKLSGKAGIAPNNFYFNQ